MRPAKPGTIFNKRSHIDGLGAFARCALPARRKLGELDGELVSMEEVAVLARQRERLHLVEFDDTVALDCSNGTSPLRYVNHSCAPNTYMRIAYRRVEFYALRDIEAGEELTAHYGETHHEGTLPCRCGADRCQGFI